MSDRSDTRGSYRRSIGRRRQAQGTAVASGQSVLTTAIEEDPRTSPHARWQLRRNIVRSEARTSVIWEAEHLRHQGSVEQPL